jgi:hypothetical protein
VESAEFVFVLSAEHRNFNLKHLGIVISFFYFENGEHMAYIGMIWFKRPWSTGYRWMDGWMCDIRQVESIL